MAIRRITPSWRTTVGTITETAQDLQQLFAKLGSVVCPDCQVRVEPATPDRVIRELEALPPGTRVQLGFEWPVAVSLEQTGELLRHAGFSRVVAGGKTVDVSAVTGALSLDASQDVLVIVDRITAGRTDPGRVRESLEMAFSHGAGEAVVLAQVDGASRSPPFEGLRASHADRPPVRRNGATVDGQPWEMRRYSVDPRCPNCRRRFPAPEPALFQHQSVLGACPRCRGAGVVGARTKELCPECRGARLNADALIVRLDGRTFAEWTTFTTDECLRRWTDFWDRLPAESQNAVRSAAGRLQARLGSLMEIGLGYLTLDRASVTLSPGESRRVQLVAALGTRLVNMLCVLDEPTAGLHRADTGRVVRLLQSLREAGNTLVVVEHNPEVIAAADLVVELGPGAGPEGGRIVWQGVGNEAATRHAELSSEDQGAHAPRSPLGWVTLSHVNRRNLKDVTVSFPLGGLCVVTGVGGSGKSTLVCDALYHAALGTPGEGFGALSQPVENVVLIDSRPLPRSVRSTPGTMLGILAPVRALFARTPDAQARNYGPLHFSFNARSDGRCPTCEGLGERQVDLQFLPDVRTVCPDCHGTRFRREVLDIRYRGLSIAEVLAMTAREAFPFFRGQPQLQKKLKALKDVGLDYLPLGRSGATLSQGEMQRLQLAAALRRGTRTRTWFLLDEPSTGLHARDVARLLDVFDLLLTAGHTLVVIDHHPELIRAADHIVDLADGEVVSAGPLEELLRCEQSVSARVLRGPGVARPDKGVEEASPGSGA
jgi:excinuclease ABC subunit A